MYVHPLHNSLYRVLGVDLCDVALTIDMIPDVALLEIFSFYLDEAWINAWHVLVHVCRMWRIVVFGSPRRLNLRLRCKVNTPMRKILEVWPPLPIVITVRSHETFGKWGMNNIIAALGEHTDSICRIDLFCFRSSQFEKVMVAMQQPFVALTTLQLQSRDSSMPAIPASFLGGTAPLLQTLSLERIRFPGLPNLLLSATHLVSLRLWDIPHSVYIPPEALVNCLSVLTRLESLFIKFESSPDRNSRCSPPRTRTVLPVLTELQFAGVCEYLENLVSRINAPLLNKSHITFFHQMIFDTPELTQFISRTTKFKAQDKLHVFFSDQEVSIELPQSSDGMLELGVLCGGLKLQLLALGQLWGLSFLLTPAVEHLYVVAGRFSPQGDISSNLWLLFFLPFITVKGLYISREFAPHIAPALKKLGGRVVEVLPALQYLFLEQPFPSGPVKEAIRQFVAARELANHPISVFRWERKK